MTTEDICPVCESPFYPGCRNRYGGGANIVKLRENKTEYVEMCPNNTRRHLRNYMQAIDPKLWSQTPFRNTPLYNKKDGVDRTKDDLFISSIDWGSFLSHLKWVAGYKCGQSSFIKVASDRTLLDIFVGNRNYKNQMRERLTNESFVCNSLEEFLESPDLVIIQLGGLRHPNRAAANILKESLLIRRRLGKSTWLVEPHDKAFTPFYKNDFGTSEGLPSCDEEVSSYVDENFEKIELDVVEGARITQYEEDDEEGTVSLGEDGPSEFNEVVPDEEVDLERNLGEEADIDDLLKEAKPKRVKYKKKGRGRY